MAALTTSTISWNNVNTLTERIALPRITDQIFRSNVLTNKLYKNGTKLSGGAFIVQNLAYAEGPGGSFEGMEAHDVSERDQFAPAIFNWKHYYVSITVRRADELKNSGKAALGKLLMNKMKIAEKTMRNLLAQGIYSDGGSSKDITGLRAMVATTAVYGNISKTTNAFWRSQVDSTTTTLSINSMRTMMGQCTEDTDTPDLMVCPQAVYDIYYGLLQPQQRFASESMAKGGFTSIMFEGRPLAVDSHCPAGFLYFLNTDYIDFVSHEDENMRFEPFKRPFRQAGRSAFIYWFGNLTGSNCRFQGVMNAIAN